MLSGFQRRLTGSKYRLSSRHEDNSCSLTILVVTLMQYVFPLLAIFIWAGNTVVNKMAVGAIFPAEIGFYRWVLAALLFTPFMFRQVLAHWSQIRPNLGRISLSSARGARHGGLPEPGVLRRDPDLGHQHGHHPVVDALDVLDPGDPQPRPAPDRRRIGRGGVVVCRGAAGGVDW